VSVGWSRVCAVCARAGVSWCCVGDVVVAVGVYVWVALVFMWLCVVVCGGVRAGGAVRHAGPHPRVCVRVVLQFDGSGQRSASELQPDCRVAFRRHGECVGTLRGRDSV
jgi:hypothetical protein